MPAQQIFAPPPPETGVIGRSAVTLKRDSASAVAIRTVSWFELFGSVVAAGNVNVPIGAPAESAIAIPWPPTAFCPAVHIRSITYWALGAAGVPPKTWAMLMPKAPLPLAAERLSVDWLLPDVGSEALELTEAVLEIAPPAARRTAIVTVASLPEESDPRAQATEAVPEQLPWLDVADAKTSPAGSAS